MPRSAPSRPPLRSAWRRVAGAGALMAPVLAGAQLPEPAAPATPQPPVLPSPDARLDRVDITGAVPDETRERRESTAAKIVIGREEIERFGDTTLGDVLKRLPGVTIQGRPGGDGAIRLRGLGSGYTQILLDGERVPSGFSIDSLTPEQVERIEVLRAPTAETGARAIAGTINIVTRGGYTKRVNDVRLGLAFENGGVSPGVSWTRNDTLGAFIYNHSLSVFGQNRASDASTTTEDRRLDDGTVTLDQHEVGTVREQRRGVHASGRLQWRGAAPGSSLVLTPLLLYSASDTRRTGVLEQRVGATPPPYETSETAGDGGYRLGRLHAQWNQGVAESSRIEARAGISAARWDGHSLRLERTDDMLVRTLLDDTETNDRTLTASGKLIALVAGEHSLVAGVESEHHRRTDSRVTLQDGMPLLADFGEDVSASSTRLALYAQDEWSATPNWALQAGLRWEGIETNGSGSVEQPAATNRSSVWTPLLHAVWKPDPKGRDQLRISLTRSYRSPTLANLIARPSLNTRNPVPGPNTPTQPDRAGNPDLRPELATGLDVAVERYLPASGVLSANLFYRRISDYLRSQVALETVSWASQPRYVSRPQNVGAARTQGLELEA